jgi:SAM-dependent methyltransferase
MARITTPPGPGKKPGLERDKVASFFEERARRIPLLGAVKAVIYQDKHPTLAEERDAREKEILLPLLALDGRQRLLDVGCGTGRWYESVRRHIAHYHGVDASPGLLAHARATYGESSEHRFTELLANHLSLSRLAAASSFDRILCAGLLIYLNDDEVTETLRGFVQVAAPSTRIVVREPVALHDRLSLVDHYSDDLESTYNSIYRTDAELLDMFRAILFPHGFTLTESRDLFSSPELNNRAETRQRIFILDRA